MNNIIPELEYVRRVTTQTEETFHQTDIAIEKQVNELKSICSAAWPPMEAPVSFCKHLYALLVLFVQHLLLSHTYPHMLAHTVAQTDG